MKKLTLIVVCILILSLTGCSKAATNTVKTGYYMSENQLSFLQFQDNQAFMFCRCIMMSYVPSGTYEILNDELKLKDNQNNSYDFSFVFQGDSLLYKGAQIGDYVHNGDAFVYCGTDYPVPQPES